MEQNNSIVRLKIRNPNYAMYIMYYSQFPLHPANISKYEEFNILDIIHNTIVDHSLVLQAHIPNSVLVRTFTLCTQIAVTCTTDFKAIRNKRYEV